MTERELVRAKRLQKDLDAASKAFDGKTRRALALAKEVCAQAPDQSAGFAAAAYFAIACQDYYVEPRVAYRRAVALVPTQIEFLANLALAEAFLGAPA